MLNLLKGVTPCEWLDVSNPCEGILCAVLALRNRRENETGSKNRWLLYFQRPSISRASIRQQLRILCNLYKTSYNPVILHNSVCLYLCYLYNGFSSCVRLTLMKRTLVIHLQILYNYMLFFALLFDDIAHRCHCSTNAGETSCCRDPLSVI